MLFITNRTKKINANFIKELDVNLETLDHIFSIKITDNADNRFFLDVDILELLKGEYRGTSLEDYDLKAFARQIREKTINDFEQLNCLETALHVCENSKVSTIKEIDIEELVYDNLLKFTDEFVSKIH